VLDRDHFCNEHKLLSPFEPSDLKRVLQTPFAFDQVVYDFSPEAKYNSARQTVDQYVFLEVKNLPQPPLILKVDRQNRYRSIYCFQYKCHRLCSRKSQKLKIILFLRI
jgi:hypothetical protein